MHRLITRCTQFIAKLNSDSIKGKRGSRRRDRLHSSDAGGDHGSSSSSGNDADGAAAAAGDAQHNGDGRREAAERLPQGHGAHTMLVLRKGNRF